MCIGSRRLSASCNGDMNMSINLKTLSVAAAVAGAISATGAHANTINITSVNGLWTSTDPGAPDVTGQNTNEIRWGDPAFNGDVPDDQSGYLFEGNAPQNGVAANSNFVLGTFTHFNNPITDVSLKNATLSVSINFDILDVDSNVIESRTVDSVFDFAHLETDNKLVFTLSNGIIPNPNATCADGGPNAVGVNINGCADRVTAVTNTGILDSFRVGDDHYVFDVSGFCVDCNPLALFDEFWTTENAENSAQLVARWTQEANVVPLPAAGWMLLAGLGGLGIMSRRRRKLA
jgi:hypothetical protein